MSKTRAALLFILIVLAGIFAGSYIRVYLLGPGENAGKTPVTTPGPLSPEAPKEITSPLTGSVTGDQVPTTDAERAQDKAASLSSSAALSGTAR